MFDFFDNAPLKQGHEKQSAMQEKRDSPRDTQDSLQEISPSNRLLDLQDISLKLHHLLIIAFVRPFDIDLQIGSHPQTDIIFLSMHAKNAYE